MTSLQSILVPADGSPPSLAAIEQATALAESGDVHVDVLQVVTPEEFSIGSSNPLTPGARRQTDEALDAAVAEAIGHLGARLSRRTIAGDPLRTILGVAREGHYDLVVLGTHGRIGRLHTMLGSVAEGVVRNAPCPVLTVREPGDGYESFAEHRHGRPSVGEPTKH